MKGPTSLELQEIYLPVQEGLAQVEERLQALARQELPQLSQPLGHTVVYPGKRLRPALTLLAGQLYGRPSRHVLAMALAMELFHTATLVHDDLVDNSRVRRGRPAAHTLWGPGPALLLGDYLFSLSAQLMASTRNLRVIDIFAQTLKTVSGGELAHNLRQAQERRDRQGYFQWIGAKTASVLAAATQTGAILGHAPPAGVKALKEYGFKLGLAFQIVDDILDFTGEERELGKPVGSDLLRGALTLPVILLLEKQPSLEDPKAIQQAARGLSHSPIMEECYAVASEFSSQARRSLEAAPPSPARSSLEALVAYNLERKK